MAAILNIPTRAKWIVALALTWSGQAIAQVEGNSRAVDGSNPTGGTPEPSVVTGDPSVEALPPITVPVRSPPPAAPVPAVAVAPAPSKAAPPPCACAKEPEPPPVERWLEASFGSAQKFFDQSVSDPTGFVKRRTIPVNTVRVLGEWLALPRFSAMVLFDLPLEPRSTLVDGVITQAYVPPSLSGGIRWSAFTLGAPVDTVFEGQTIVLLGSTLAAIGRETVFPSLGWRVHLHDQQGFTLYAGASYEFRFNIIALTYGVGHRF